MEFFQEPTYTAFLALILSFIVARIVSFAVSHSKTDGNSVVCAINEGAADAKGVTTLDKGLRVRSAKSKKRVKFVDDDGDVVITRVADRYEGSENLVSLDDVESVSEAIVEEKNTNEKFRENDDQFVVNDGLNEYPDGKMGEGQCLERETAEKEEKNLVISELNNSIIEEQKSEMELEGDDMISGQKEGTGGLGTGENEGLMRDESVECEDDDDDDDWEGIERSELERVFAEAVNYLEYGGKGKEKEDDDRLAKLGSAAQMQLYGLHKVAVEGPCHEPQPMALKVSARAKWNAWQRLGSMSAEVAMEQYIRVLSESIPGWMHNYSADDDIQGHPKSETVDKISVPGYERKLDLSAITVGDSSTGGSSVEKVTPYSDDTV